MKKKLAALCLAAWLCLSLSGCSFTGLDARNLMSPPKANADQQAIHRLLQGNRSDGLLIYPKSGEYRSAIIMQDFTGDGQKDAMGFYALEDSGSVTVQFLVKLDEEWTSVSEFTNTATQVDRVCFGDLTGDGVSEVIIGWGSAAGATGRTAAVSVYSFHPVSGMTEYFLGVYGEMALTDLNDDGVCEVFTADKFLPAEVEGDEPSPAKVRLYQWDGNDIRETLSADADNAITSYSAATFGALSPDLTGVLLDGAKADGIMTTQIFFLANDMLLSAPAGVNSETYFNLSSRPSSASCLCRDINGNGFLEIPSVTPLSCLPGWISPDSTSYMVRWHSFRPEKGDLSPVTLCLINQTEGYRIDVPWFLEGRISAVNDPEFRTVTYFYVLDQANGEKFLGPPLFSLQAFPQSVWDSLGPDSGYELLETQGDTVYGILVRTKDKKLLSYVERLRADFHLLG